MTKVKLMLTMGPFNQSSIVLVLVTTMGPCFNEVYVCFRPYIYIYWIGLCKSIFNYNGFLLDTIIDFVVLYLPSWWLWYTPKNSTILWYVAYLFNKPCSTKIFFYVCPRLSRENQIISNPLAIEKYCILLGMKMTGIVMSLGLYGQQAV